MFTRILVPTDFSGPSHTALDRAATLARQFGATLRLLHVLEDSPTEGPFAGELFVSERPDIRTERLKEARERLAHCAASIPAAVRVTTEVICGAPARTILDYAEDHHFDLIVMGTHGRVGVTHLLVGSVAERVVRESVCPVMTVHGPHPPTRKPAARSELSTNV